MYREWAPDERVTGRVTCAWTSETRSATTKLVVPDSCVDLVWGARGVHVAGPDTGPKPVTMAPDERYVGVRFRCGSAGEVFGVPLTDLRDLRVPLSELGPLTGLSALDALIAGTGDRSPRAVAATMQRALAVRLRSVPDPDPAAPVIARALLAGRSVAEVARDLGFGERQFLRRTSQIFGYGPKVLQRVVRFQRALGLARNGMPASEVAATSGYADQSHLANEVRRLAGVPLGRLVAPSGDQPVA
ncbi:AraC family transcriptional regulator [Streptosporangium longisporum]|uniref:Helix-turn-helix transcriptional regulator n=1 Tax=Streptosporangium longisporum TaxID=46187 RepID=A0ABP6LCZ8_9ACTN